MNATATSPSTTNSGLTKIKNGLKLIETSQTYDDPFQVKPGAPLPAIEDLAELVKNNEELAQSYVAFLGNLEIQILNTRQDRINNALGVLGDLVRVEKGFGLMGVKQDALNEVQRAALAKIDKEIGELRVGVFQMHQGDLIARQQRLNEAEQQMATFVRTYPTPLSYLEVQGLSDPKRSTYHANVAHAGPNALHTLAMQAIQTGDRALGAAVAARFGQIPEDQRKFSAAQLANALVAGEHNMITGSHNQIRTAHNAASNALRQFLAGKPVEMSSHDKIKYGVENYQALWLAPGDRAAELGRELSDIASVTRADRNPHASSDRSFEEVMNSKYPARKGSGKEIWPDEQT